ncbi:major facilitator superfamily transporter [Tritrichomonas foetus]|uniref:Major facilitator superfamily transporter n=1 Tax=Tritrichomonas foetus TaxID=1144522 RepID=A0A1J4JRR2_9EUKA|nr:major facilitator superfamily transporter [Tritrichomonas foetus]|eukprot:OHT00212.1 major facilitator superfamily transporter [Tritrichomonas foetus]
MGIFKRGKNWVPLNQRERVNPLWIAAIAANQLTAFFVYTPINILTNPMCQKLELSTVATSWVLLIGSFVGILVPPFIANWSDTTTLKFGRRRPWILGGCAATVVGLMFIVFCENLSKDRNGKITVFIFGVILAFSGANIIECPGRTMCSDLVPASQQVLVSNICMTFNALAGVISNLIGALELYKYTSLGNENLVILVSCIIGFVALCVSVISAPEERLSEKPEVVNPFLLIARSFKFYDKYLYMLACAFACFQLAATQFVVQSANYIAVKVFHGSATDPIGGNYDKGISFAMTLSLIQTIIQFLYSFLNTWVIKVIGLKWTWVIGMSTCAIADILFFFVMPKWCYLIPYACIAITQVVSMSVPFAVIALVTPSDRLAGVISVLNFFLNIGGLLAHFGLTMGLGSVKKFQEDTGLLIGVTFVFALLGALLGWCGITIDANKIVKEEDSADEAKYSDSSDEKPDSL